MSISFIGVIIITAYVAYLCSTNRKTYPYKSPAPPLKLKESRKVKRFQVITINPLFWCVFVFMGEP